MNDIVYLTLIGLFAGTIGTGLGGLSVFFIKGDSRKLLSFLLEFTAGLMLAIVCFDLLPESFELGSLKNGIIGIILGMGIIILIDSMLEKLSFKNKHINKNSKFMRAGILLALGIALHNFPEGVAVGSSFNISITLGLSLAGVIALHDIPEGLAIAAPLKISGTKNWKVLFITIASGIPTGIGALVGGLIGKISNTAVSMCLGFAGGAMLYIIMGELLPQSSQLHKDKISTFGGILGIICGIVISSYGG